MRKPLVTAALLLAVVCLATDSGGGQPPPPGGQAEKVRPGTALAKLVAEVQQHPAAKIAAAVMTNTGHRIRSDIPTWLRAHYVRNHGHVLVAANAPDPTGGFPLALDSLYVWMLRNQDLQPPPAPKVLAAAAVMVGQNLRISGQNSTPRSESDIRINFNNPRAILSSPTRPSTGPPTAPPGRRRSASPPARPRSRCAAISRSTAARIGSSTAPSRATRPAPTSK